MSVIIFIKDKIKVLLKYGKVVTITGLIQAIIQGLNITTGIFIIRWLPTQEYGLYTIANTLLGTMTVLADGGIASALMARLGKEWDDKGKVNIIISTALRIRKYFSIGTLAICIPILIYLLSKNNATTFELFLISLSVSINFFAVIFTSILELLMKMQKNLIDLQKNQLKVSIIRFISIVVIIPFSPVSTYAILTNAAPRILGNLELNKKILQFIKIAKEYSKIEEKEIIKIIKRLYPSAIYYSFSGQITIWITSVIGATKIVAELGALNRVSVILSLMTSIYGLIIIPNYAKIKYGKAELKRYTMSIIIVNTLILILFVLFMYLFRFNILNLLGKQYINLSSPFILSVIAGCMNLISALCYSLSIARGWVINPFILVVSNITGTILGVYIYGMHNISDVLQFNVFTASIALAINFLYIFYKLESMQDA